MFKASHRVRSFASQCLPKDFYKASSIHEPCLRFKQVQHSEATHLMSPSRTSSQLPCCATFSWGIVQQGVCRGEHRHLRLTARSFHCLSSTGAQGRLESTAVLKSQSESSKNKCSKPLKEALKQPRCCGSTEGFLALCRSGPDIRFHFKSWIIITTRKITATNSREKT